MADNEAIIKARIAIDASDVGKTKEAVKGLATPPPPVEIRVEPPEPVEVPVVQPEPVEVPVEPPEPVDVAVNEDAVQEAADEAADAVDDAADRAANAVEDAADEAKRHAKDAADETVEAAEEASERTGDAAEKAADRVGGAAKDAARSTNSAAASQTSALGRVRGAVGGVTRVVNLLKSAIMGFGVIGVFTALAGAVDKVRESFGKAKEEAEKLAKANDEAARAKAIEDLAKSYERLGEAAKKAAESVQRANELQDIATRNARALEDAQMDLAEQRELAAVDAKDPAAAEKRAAISARYAAKRGGVASERSLEDVDAEFNRLATDAGAKRKAAADIEGSTKEDDRLIAETRRRLADAERRSKSLNDKDVTGFWSGVGTDLKRFATLDWGEMYETKTEKGDAVRSEAKAEAEKLRAELKRLEEQKKGKLDEAEKLRGEGDHLAKRARAVMDARDALLVRKQSTDVATQRGVSDADTALGKRNEAIAKKAAQKEEDEKTVAEGEERISHYNAHEDMERERAQAAADDYEREAGEAIDAKNRYDMLVANGGSRKEKSAALAALQKEQREADEAKYEMERVAAEVANTLKAIHDQVGALSRAVKSAKSRLNQNESDAPEG